MRRRNSVVMIVALVGLIVVGAGFGVLLSNKLDKTSADAVCMTHKVIFKSNQVSPKNTTGKLCDKLTFTNEDNITREVAFGPHENHVPYDGIASEVLYKGQSMTVTFNQAGSFRFHDHLHDELQGYFTVSR